MCALAVRGAQRAARGALRASACPERHLCSAQRRFPSIMKATWCGMAPHLSVCDTAYRMPRRSSRRATATAARTSGYPRHRRTRIGGRTRPPPAYIYAPASTGPRAADGRPCTHDKPGTAEECTVCVGGVTRTRCPACHACTGRRCRRWRTVHSVCVLGAPGEISAQNSGVFKFSTLGVAPW